MTARYARIVHSHIVLWFGQEGVEMDVKLIDYIGTPREAAAIATVPGRQHNSGG